MLCAGAHSGTRHATDPRAILPSCVDRLRLARSSLLPATASADLTAFLGVNPTPANRASRGFASGAGLRHRRVRVRVRATRARTSPKAAPALRTFMFNGLLQTPVPIAGMQFYGTAGGGVYRETLQRRRKRTSGSTWAAA